jgi:hypothetical protein
MENDPELSGKYLGTITQDFALVCDSLKEASYQLRIRGISKFPIFAMSYGELPIGQVLIAKGEMYQDWNYYFSFLENFLQLDLIKPEAIEEFEKAYKNPDEFCCLFVVDGAFNKYVFVPYPED